MLGGPSAVCIQYTAHVQRTRTKSRITLESCSQPLSDSHPGHGAQQQEGHPVALDCIQLEASANALQHWQQTQQEAAEVVIGLAI